MSLFTKIIFESQVCTFRVVLVRVYNKEFMGEIYKFKCLVIFRTIVVLKYKPEPRLNIHILLL